MPTGDVPRRAIEAVIVAVVLGAGFAAPSTGHLGAVSRATTLLDPCAEAPLDVTYEVTYSPALGGHEVATVAVTGLPATCADRQLWVTLTGADGQVLAEDTTRREGTDDVRVAGPFASPVPAAEVLEISAVLRDAPPARSS